MSQTILTQLAPEVQSTQAKVVYEYAFSLINPQDRDIQDNLTAAFPFIPTSIDWQQWLKGWTDTGYRFHTSPQLIRII